MMMVSRLLKSCATPPVSWPMPSIFCACAQLLLAQRARRSVRSRVILAKPSSSPCASRIALMTTLAQKRRAVLAHAPAFGFELARLGRRLERRLRHAGLRGPPAV